MKHGKLNLKKVQAIDNNFISKKKFLSFQDVLQSLADMFFTSPKNLDSHLMMSDYRWKQFRHHVGYYLDFYATQLNGRSQKIPKIYKLDIEQAISQPRCYCMDITPTIFTQNELVLWKCNNCKRYLSFLNHNIKDRLEAYKLL